MLELNETIEAGLELEDDPVSAWQERILLEGYKKQKLEWSELRSVKDEFVVLKEATAFKLFLKHCIFPFYAKAAERTDDNLDPTRALVERENRKLLEAIMREFRKICTAIEPIDPKKE